MVEEDKAQLGALEATLLLHIGDSITTFRHNFRRYLQKYDITKNILWAGDENKRRLDTKK